MLRYVTRRLAIAILTIFGVSIVVFLAMRIVPGGIVETLGGPAAVQSPELYARLQQKYGLEKPLVVQYGLWLGNALQGDLGESLGTRASVSHEIARRVWVTAELTLLATLFSVIVGVPAGVFAALRRGSVPDLLTRSVALVGFSIPDFVLGTVLIYFVSTRQLGLPVSGYVPLREDAWDHLRSITLPTLSLGVIITAVVMRVVRASVAEVLAEPYVVTARAKGLHPRLVARRHILRAALIPLITIVGINTGYLLSGAVIIEELFSLPGIGRYAYQGIINRDYPVAQGTVIVGALLFILANLVADLLYAVVDPRIKY
ncbi:MAG: peptide/nickel transport system permease protein [Thermomicrobiales bacterium]|jgi:peptide/nickel transport system permease protein|nr:peptide/nickel transport system permease protein [Thermomicrobiales bacterium]